MLRQGITSKTDQPLPKLTNELIRSFEEIDAVHTRQRMEGIQAQPNNPWGIDIRRFGRATAFKAEKLPNPFFNRVVGLGVDELPELHGLMSFYDGSGPFSLELVPNDISPELGQQLHDFGFVHTRFHGGFFGSTSSSGGCGFETPVSVVVKRVDNPYAFEQFLDVNFGGFELPTAIRDFVLVNMRHWMSIPDWHLYLAFVDEVPAGCAILQTREKLGYLASAATLPVFRGRGLQRCLLQARIAAAQDAGCELVCSQAEFGSVSHHNLEKAGLRLAYTKAIWTRTAVSS